MELAIFMTTGALELNAKPCFQGVFVIGSPCSIDFDDKGRFDENIRQVLCSHHTSLSVSGLVRLGRAVQ